MLLAQCDNFGRQVLVWTSDIVGVHDSPLGIAVHYLCACGEMAEMLTGAAAPVRYNVHLPRAA